MMRPIEPGILRLFRWFAGVGFGFLVLVAIANAGDNPPDPPQFPEVGLTLFGLLFLFLMVPAAQRLLGRFFLPMGILLASLASVLGSAAIVQGRLEAGLSPNESLSDYWLPFFLLFVPFLITAWQYRYRWVVVFAAGSTVLDLMAVGVVFEPYDVDLTVLGALIAARGFLFLFVGFFVAKLVARQRDLRLELEHAAATSEKLATGRERNRLARELHDTLAHSMTGTAIQLEAAQAVWDDDPNQARELVDKALGATRLGLSEARRAIADLRASPLDDLGLSGALEWLASDTTSVSGITVTASVDGDTSGLPVAYEQTVFRIAEEALVNAVRHSDASSAEINLQVVPGSIALTVADDGSGFDPEMPTEGRHGIVGMRERAELIGGTVSIESGTPGGTSVRFRAPWQP